jgi:hypothetical protein
MGEHHGEEINGEEEIHKEEDRLGPQEAEGGGEEVHEEESCQETRFGQRTSRSWWWP